MEKRSKGNRKSDEKKVTKKVEKKKVTSKKAKEAPKMLHILNAYLKY